MTEKLEDLAYRYLVRLGWWMKRRRDQRAQLRRQSSVLYVRLQQAMMDGARRAFDEEYDRIEKP